MTWVKLDDAFGRNPKVGKGIKPLEELSPENRARIEFLAAQPSPPPQWITFGDEIGRPLASIPSRAWYEWHRAHPDATTDITTALRRAVIGRDGYVCGICGDEVEPPDVHIDHIHPRSRGGKTEPDNLRVTHSLCNMRKGAKV